MAMRAPKPDLSDAAVLAIESDELHQPEIDAFIARNREALNESLVRSYAEAEWGEFSTRTIEDIITDGHRRHIGHPEAPA